MRASLTSFFLSSVSPLSLFLDLLQLLLLPPCFLPPRPPAPVPPLPPISERNKGRDIKEKDGLLL